MQGELTEEQRSLNDQLPTTMASFEGSRVNEFVWNDD